MDQEIKDDNPANPDNIPAVVKPNRRIIPSKLGLVVINQRPLFPHMVVPIVVEGSVFLNTIQSAANAGSQFFMIALGKENFNAENFQPDDVFEIGVVARIVKVFQMSGDVGQVLLDVITRAEITKFEVTSKNVMVDINIIEDEKIEINDTIRAYSREIITNLKEIIKLSPLVREELGQFINQINIDDPQRLADFAATLTSAGRFELQEILSERTIQKRLEKTLLLIKKELDLGRLQAKISSQIEDRVSKNQREFFLKEQLKEIRKELGLSKDEKTQEIEKFQKRAKSLKWPAEVAKVFKEEIEKLSLLDTQSPEFNVTRSYVDWLTVLPWGVYATENLNIKRAQKVLDEDHFGLEDVKDRILNMIASMVLRGDHSGKIICLIGPPGVGKTSIGKSIARALKRPFYRFSLGGMRDEAEIKGHRRTYIGAMPGKLIQSLKTAGKSNAVIMLDEIDKISQSYHGDPASALLEVLDREQNPKFLDHYLDVPFDLSKILFIATANQMDTIPEPLQDRMEVIRIAGYIGDEKLQIAKKYLVPKQLKENGLKTTQIKFEEGALRKIIAGYAREAGVRDLEKKIELICQKVARKIVENELETKTIITEADVETYLKKPIFLKDEVIGKNKAGSVTGLAWTSHGGAILSIEATVYPANSKGFKQTGQLGKVMVESSEIAYSYIFANAKTLGLDVEPFVAKLVHLHVPAGATPKDGPSAGVAMALALMSLVMDKAVKTGLCMTGELSLTGEVLPIGGLKEKIIAALRAGLKEVIVPSQNQVDFDEMPDHLKNGYKIHFVKDFKEVVKIAFESTKLKSKNRK